MAPQARSRWWLLPLVSAGAFAATFATLFLLGVGGYRAGWLWASAALLAVVAISYWRAGPAFPGRVVWTIAALVAAATSVGWLGDHSPMSAARLHAEIDAVAPPFARQVSERASGHSWCRPTCPVVERVYRAPKTATFGALLNVAGQLRKRGALPNLIEVGRLHPQTYLHVPAERYVADIRVAIADDHLKVTIRVASTHDRHPEPAPPTMG